jgi:hypothetical protein
VKPPSQIVGWGFWIGSGVTLMFWKSKNSLLKVTVSPASASNYFEGLVGSRSALFERHTETLELFPFDADPGAELETTAGDHINGRNILGKAYGIVKRHQEHSGYDTDPVGAGGDRRGCGQDRGQTPVFDEVVLRQPHIIKPLFSPHAI